MPDNGYREWIQRKPDFGFDLNPSFAWPPCFALLANEGGGAPFDQVTGRQGNTTTSLPTWSTLKAGPALSFSSSSLQFSTMKGAKVSEGTTIGRFAATAISGSQRVVLDMGSGSGGSGNDYRILISTTGTLTAALYASSAYQNTSIASGVTLGSSRTFAFVNSVSQSRNELWLAGDGYPLTLATGTYFQDISSSHSYALIGSPSSGGGLAFTGLMDFLYIFPVALPAPVIQSLLVEDPYQPILGERIRRIKRGLAKSPPPFKPIRPTPPWTAPEPVG